MKLRQPVSYYVEGVLGRNRTILAQAITLVESALEADEQLAQAMLTKLLPYTGNAHRIGITGVPGVGKSTFIEAFGRLLAEQGKQVAVLAVDPSSARSHGSILGDKTRMHRLAVHPHAFIRPSPSAGALGGVGRRTRETSLICEAAGFDVILVETVGVGQSETEVKDMTDVFLLLMLPGAGDELQGMKRGIMEMADILIINKADGTNLEKARIARANYTNALHLFPPHPAGWTVPVLLASALEIIGIPEIWEQVRKYHASEEMQAYIRKRRQTQTLAWFDDLIREAVLNRYLQQPVVLENLARLKAAILAQHITVPDAVKSLVASL